jgi:very-short-patch-repair endonuclease
MNSIDASRCGGCVQPFFYTLWCVRTRVGSHESRALPTHLEAMRIAALGPTKPPGFSLGRTRRATPQSCSLERASRAAVLCRPAWARHGACAWKFEARRLRRASEALMQNCSLTLELRARQFRSDLNPSEAALWRALQGARLGAHFRRQVVVGDRYIVDFLAPARRLILEVDGGYHASRRAADARRDRKLARLGYRVLRLDAELVRQNLEQAVAQIRAALAEPP